MESRTTISSNDLPANGAARKAGAQPLLPAFACQFFIIFFLKNKNKY
jgi:hypothetical protein